MLGLLVAAPLTLVSALNHPFSGISVTPDAYVKLVDRFDEISATALTSGR